MDLPASIAATLSLYCLTGAIAILFAELRSKGRNRSSASFLAFGDFISGMLLWPFWIIVDLIEERELEEEAKRLKRAEAKKTAEVEQQNREEAALLGTTGTTISALRPRGVIEVNGRRIDARSSRGLLAPGTPIRVVAFSDRVAVVEPE